MSGVRATLKSAAAWLAVVACAALVATGCSEPRARSQQVASGSLELGEASIIEYGCASCHVIPGIRSEPSYIGPPLDHWGRRAYIAGALNNNEANLVRWITAPEAVEPGTAMPNLGVTEEEAGNIAAYLLSIE